MAKRTGIGATMASAAIFSVLLAANTAVYVASQARAQTYSESNIEDSIEVTSAALVGAEATDVLSRIQASMQGSTFHCVDAIPAISKVVGKEGGEENIGNLTVISQPRLYDFKSALDNLTLVAPFDGGEAGALNVKVSFVESENQALAGVSFQRNETHVVHLPIAILDAQNDCLLALDNIESLSSTGAVNCTLSVVSSMFNAAIRGPSLDAAANGLDFVFSFSLYTSGGCTSSYSISVGKADAIGPTGHFSVFLVENGSVSF